MTPLEQALQYARRVPIFPCRWDGGPRLRKTPLTSNGFEDASRDPTTTRQSWTCWPQSLIGMPTGEISGLVVLDVDVKCPEANGFDSLEDLGRSVLTETAIAHTESGGLHIYFRCPQRDVRNNAGRIGAGLDVRANGGYIILPSPGSGYTPDNVWNFEIVEPVEAPAWLWPAPASRSRILAHPGILTTGLSSYAEASLDAACNVKAVRDQTRSLFVTQQTERSTTRAGIALDQARQIVERQYAGILLLALALPAGDRLLGTRWATP